MAGEHQVKALLQLVSGVGDLTRARAQDAARGLMELPGGESAGRLTGQVAALADELLATATANRENLLGLVRSEVEAAVARLGLARDAQGLDVSEELERLRQENASLRAKLELREAAEASAGRRGSGAKNTRRATTAAGASTTAARKRSSSRTAKRPVARSTPERATAGSTGQERPTAKQATAKQATSKRAPAKRSTATQGTARRAQSTRSTGRGTSTSAGRRGDAEQG